MAEQEENTYPVNHKFREEIIVPWAAITNNIDFVFGRDEKHVLLADGTYCTVLRYEEKNICELEADITRIYGMPAWAFLKRWYASYPHMDSISFIKMILRKDEI